MSIIPLSTSQRRRLQAALGEARDARLYRRFLALLALDRGEPVSRVAASLGVTRQSLYNWVRAYRRSCDPHALADRYGAGRPMLWDEGLRRRLRGWLRQTPDRLGYAAVHWTVPLLREHLERRGGRRLSDDTIRRELDRQGYVWKRFRYVLPPDPEAEKKTAHPPMAAKPAPA
jgi:transposase